MLSILYLVLCTVFGWILLESVIPGLKDMGRETYDHKELGIAAPVIMLPASWLTGTIFHTWLVYIAAFIVMKIRPETRTPLTPANIAAAIVTVTIGCLLYVFVIRKRERKPLYLNLDWHVLLILPLTIFLILHFYRTFHYTDGSLRVGLSVFSDFATHVGMMRSFSFGNNIPAQYSHFAGVDIRYHFMFQFFSGNLEYLGLRIDHAFNIASILSMLSACVLLYVNAVKLIGKRIGGMLTVIFMLFHSSPSLFKHLAEIEINSENLKQLWDRTEFFAYTQREDWGLWNFKVYMNQRHLAFALAITFLALIIFTPLVVKMKEKLSECESRGDRLRAFFVSPDGWFPENVPMAVGLGLLLGAMAFWNGAMLIGCLSILFVMAIFSERRLEYLITALIAVLLSFLQTSIFIDGKAMDLEVRFGFLADNGNIFSVAKYLIDLAWPLPLLIIVCLFVQKGYSKLRIIAFSAPMIIAFTLSMVPELAVNHKYVMLSFILFGIPVSELLCEIWNRRIAGKIAAVIMCLLLVCTGLYECRILWNLDENAFEYRDDDPLIEWIHENTDSHDIWLTPMYHIARPVVAGALLYYGWPYYSWGAGYDTLEREDIVRNMYAAENVDTLKSLTAREGISYIIVDNDARSQYLVEEDTIAAAFPVVYTEGEGDWKLTVYKAK